jgi:hypothetical protein
MGEPGLERQSGNGSAMLRQSPVGVDGAEVRQALASFLDRGRWWSIEERQAPGIGFAPQERT